MLNAQHPKVHRDETRPSPEELEKRRPFLVPGPACALLISAWSGTAACVGRLTSRTLSKAGYQISVMNCVFSWS